VAGRYRLAVRLQAEKDRKYIVPHVLVYGCGKVTKAGCMNMVTEIQGKR
jgi:Holliday junction resolvasome RuvABC ATP-dependent DNA helicase subunit